MPLHSGTLSIELVSVSKMNIIIILFGLWPSRGALVSLPESRPGRPSAKPCSSAVVVSQLGEDILAEGPLAHYMVKNRAEMSLKKHS